MPNILLNGPPGTGKTSLIYCLLNELFGKNNLKYRVLELNASDDRGIDAIRDRVKRWAKIVCTENETIDGNRKIEYKVIILDEADMMTYDAQSALRRIIEDTAKNTRFIMICNYIEQIIMPIKSRFVIFYVRPIPLINQIEQLNLIGEHENFNLSYNILEFIAESTQGDLRSAINIFQTAKSFFDSNCRLENIKSLMGIPEDSVLSGFDQCVVKDYTDVYNFFKKLSHNRWDTTKLFEIFAEKIRLDSHLDDNKKFDLIYKLSNFETMLHQRGDSDMILLNFILQYHEFRKTK